METKKPRLSKRTIYTIFLAKFIFSLLLIFWTLKMVFGAGVGLDDDNTFLSTYHKVDDNYNKIVNNNAVFNRKYDVEIKINNTLIKSITYSDIYLSQRVIKRRKTRKNILFVNKPNNITIKVFDKQTKKLIKNIDASVVFTMPSTHKFDKKITLNNNAQFTIPKQAYWNIMGVIKVNKDEGNFYIKTNAI